MRANGVLAGVAPSIHRLAGAPQSEASRQIAALLYVREPSALTLATAGAAYGLRRMNEPDVVHVIVPQQRISNTVPWIRTYHTSWGLDEHSVAGADGIRLLSPLRLLFEMAAHFPERRFLSSAEDMWHRALITPADAGRFLEEYRRSGRSGVRAFETWIDSIDGRGLAMMSGAEVDLAFAMERIGLPTPERQFPLRLPNGTVVHLDLALPDARLAIEPGASWWHGGDERMRADYERDLSCAAVGWQVMRFDDTQTRKPMRCAEQIRMVYDARKRF